MKDKICSTIELLKTELIEMSDNIFDNPETCFKENYAVNMLSQAFKDAGFETQVNVFGLETAFRSEKQIGEGGPTIGLLCEYDALPMGHACGHQLQGPTMLGAAKSIIENVKGNYKLVIYGTPAEEGGGGKILMLREGAFSELDVALMMHGGPNAQVDVKSMASSSIEVTFHGKSAHAALKPENGVSAFDALLLSFNGLEFLREHIKEDSRIHYTVLDAGGPANVVPEKAVGSFYVRSYNSAYLEELYDRFVNVMKGAALMTGTTVDIIEKKRLLAKVPVIKLNDLVMKHAHDIGATKLAPPREKTGSSDFGNVMNEIPGTCVRVHFVPEGTSSHSKVYLEKGKTEEAHNAIVEAAKIIALTVNDLVSDPSLLEEIKKEFKNNKELH